MTTTISKSFRVIFCIALGALAGGCQGSALGNTNANDNANNVNTNDNTDPDGGVDADADLCGVGDDEKLVGATARIWDGTPDPEQCLSAGQQRAVGALIFQYYGWTNGCTGTVIDDDTVLTAAHCVLRWDGSPMDPTGVRFTIGNDALAPEHTFYVSSVHAHPDYNQGGDASHDMGLLKLAEPISAAPNPILPVPVNRTDLPPSLLGQTVQNAGFGETAVSQDNSLLWWSVEELTEIDPGWFQVYGGGAPDGSSVCYGDSGGPSFHLWNGHSLTLMGTVSWGDPSCMDYDYFARADDNLTWIEGLTGPGATPAPLDPCVGIDAAGQCDGDVALWCDTTGGPGTHQLRQQCCGDLGTTCAVNASGQSRCTGDTCNGVTFQGECDGNDAVWCDSGQLMRRRCEPCNQVCAYVDATLGFYCVDP